MRGRRTGFRYHDIVSVTVEDDGEPHAINLSANNRTWTILVAEKRSRDKLAVCLGARGLEQQILDIYADEKIYAQSLLKDATEAVSLTKEWPETSTYKEEFALLRKRKAWAAEQDGAIRDQSGP